jgi:tripartite-type tricarboxylate transporter receptor subunit TctC
MKYILSLIFSVICLNSYAELPTTIPLYYAQLTGGKINVCRALFDLYDKKYNTSTVFINKPGADGLLAMEEMLKSKDFSLLCSGPSESVFNNIQYPGHEVSHNALTMVSIISVSPFSFITGNNNKYSTLPELLKSRKPITVGYHAQGLKFIAQTAFGDYPVTWVPYKNSSEALASLMDGTLDLYTDGGALEIIAKSGKLKSLGHLNGLDNTSGVNLNKVYPLAAKFPVFIAVTTLKN